MRYFKQGLTFILLSFCLISLSQATPSSDAPQTPEKLIINGNFNVRSPVSATTFQVPVLLVQNTINAGNEVITKNLAANNGTADKIVTSTIKAKDDTLVITADLSISNSIQANTVEAPSFILNGEIQWYMLKYDDFETKESTKGWSVNETSQCEGMIASNNFLGGHCKTSSQPISKVFEDLPEHTHIKIQARYHMFDNWEGEYGYMKADDQLAWTQTGKTPSHAAAFNICGGNTADPKYNSFIEVIIPHTQDTLFLEFGSSLTKDPCDASYGIDDVMIFAK